MIEGASVISGSARVEGLEVTIQNELPSYFLTWHLCKLGVVDDGLSQGL